MPRATAKDAYRAPRRSPHSLRLHDDSWDRFAPAAEAVQARDANTWAVQVLEAAAGHVRCKRGSCQDYTPPVPVTFGDITGMTFGEAAALAVKAWEDQHPRHEGKSVFIGAEGRAAAPVAARAVRFMEPKQATA